MKMHSDTVTIFNYYESGTASVWYPHVLSGVYLEIDHGAMIKKYGPETNTNAELHIDCINKDGKNVITDASGKELVYLPPKTWAKQVNDELPESITFNPATDFFWKGEWTGENPVNDEDYADRLSEGFYAYMNRENDFVFLITSSGGPYKTIPHFEILGA